MSKKYIPPLPDKLPPQIPEYIETSEQVFEEYRKHFERVFNSPEFIASIEALGNSTEATGNFWIDRFFAAKMIQKKMADNPDPRWGTLVNQPLWEIAAATEAALHTHGLSSDQRVAGAIFKN